MQKMQFRSLSWEVPLKKEMATLSSILALETPWTAESGGLVYRVKESWTQLSN